VKWCDLVAQVLVPRRPEIRERYEHTSIQSGDSIRCRAEAQEYRPPPNASSVVIRCSARGTTTAVLMAPTGHMGMRGGKMARDLHRERVLPPACRLDCRDR
jgi:hypothetical protein